MKWLRSLPKLAFSSLFRLLRPRPTARGIPVAVAPTRDFAFFHVYTAKDRVAYGVSAWTIVAVQERLRSPTGEAVVPDTRSVYRAARRVAVAVCIVCVLPLYGPVVERLGDMIDAVEAQLACVQQSVAARLQACDALLTGFHRGLVERALRPLLVHARVLATARTVCSSPALYPGVDGMVGRTTWLSLVVDVFGAQFLALLKLALLGESFLVGAAVVGQPRTDDGVTGQQGGVPFVLGNGSCDDASSNGIPCQLVPYMSCGRIGVIALALASLSVLGFSRRAALLGAEWEERLQAWDSELCGRAEDSVAGARRYVAVMESLGLPLAICGVVHPFVPWEAAMKAMWVLHARSDISSFVVGTDTASVPFDADHFREEHSYNGLTCCDAARRGEEEGGVGCPLIVNGELHPLIDRKTGGAIVSCIVDCSAGRVYCLKQSLAQTVGTRTSADKDFVELCLDAHQLVPGVEAVSDGRPRKRRLRSGNDFVRECSEFPRGVEGHVDSGSATVGDKCALRLHLGVCTR